MLQNGQDNRTKRTQTTLIFARYKMNNTRLEGHLIQINCFLQDTEFHALTGWIALVQNVWLRFYSNQRKAEICFIPSLTVEFFWLFNAFCINHKLHWDFHMLCHYLWNTYRRYGPPRPPRPPNICPGPPIYAKAPQAPQYMPRPRRPPNICPGPPVYAKAP